MHNPLNLTTNQNQQPIVVSTVRKPYVKPEITHELKLETRAGSPRGPDFAFNPLKQFDPRPRI